MTLRDKDMPRYMHIAKTCYDFVGGFRTSSFPSATPKTLQVQRDIVKFSASHLTPHQQQNAYHCFQELILRVAQGNILSAAGDTFSLEEGLSRP